MIAALDLLNEVADRKGWPQISTIEVAEADLRADHRKMLRLLNRILQTVGGYNDWPMLREEGTLVLVAAEEGDSDSSEFVTATQNSDTVTVANASFDETYIGRGFQVSGDEYVYRITAVPSTTQLKLNRAWVSDNITVADEKTYTIAMDRYALPEDFGRTIDDWKSFFGQYKIEPRDPNEFRELRRDAAYQITLGDPDYFTVYGLTNGRQVVHFHPWPENARLLLYEYQRRHPIINSDQDMVLFPVTYLNSLIDLMVYFLDRDYDGNSVKSDKVLRDWVAEHNRQQSNPGMSDAVPLLQLANDVRTSIYQSAMLPNSVDWGDAFDTGSIYGF